MRDYRFRFEGKPSAKIADLDTSTILHLIENLRRGKVKINNKKVTAEALMERLQLELQIRAWGIRDE